MTAFDALCCPGRDMDGPEPAEPKLEGADSDLSPPLGPGLYRLEF